MVFVAPIPKVERLIAYLLPSFPLSELPAFKQAFEFGTCAPFYLMLELKIAHAPADWAGQSFEYMRRKEDETGREEPFVVVDERGAGGRAGAVWYVEHFATEDEVEDGEAASTSVVWRIPVKTENVYRPVPPKRVARLKEGLAETVGLVNEWSIPTSVRSWKKPDGTKRQFPEGSIELYLKYDPDFDWPEYKWPEGSL